MKHLKQPLRGFLQNRFHDTLTLKLMLQKYLCTNWFFREELVDLQLYYSQTIFQEVFKHMRLIRVKVAGCFCREAPPLMFGWILNAPLSEKVTTAGVTQKNLELPLLPNSFDSHQTQNNKMKFWTDPTLLLPWMRTHPLGR